MPNNDKTQGNSDLSDIFSYLKDDLKKIDQIIIDNCQGDAALISEIANHIILSGGKRVRPILTLLSSRLCGYNDQLNHNYNLAAAVELIHTATLLHDDVVDESDLRRGKQTSNAIWGNKASILVGDYLLSTAFQLMVKSNSIRVLDLLSNVSKIMSDGELLQLMNSTDIDISKEKYLQIISQKTAILFSASTAVGAIISGSDINTEESLYSFGNNLGIAFQIMDDVLDYSANKEDMGKEVGDDFFEGKVTLPVIIAYEKSDKQEKEKIKEIFQANLISDEKNQDHLQVMISLIDKYKTIDSSMNYALSYSQKAIENLNIFDDSKEKQMLISILNYAVKRKK